MKTIPFHALYDPTIQALHKLGGSGTIQEIHDEVVAILELSEEEIAKPLKPDQSSPTQVAYRLGWVRTWLKRYGLIENSSRGVWALTPAGRSIEEVDGKEIERVVNEMLKQEKAARPSVESEDYDELLTETEDSEPLDEWRDALSRVLAEMHPIAFERLCQRILRESGFTKVEVTKASHDGGIDGKGLLQVNDFLTFRVVFQCKRYKGSVGPDVVQQLRGAMPGSVDRGLIVTTGHFTRGAVREATRGDKTPIELVNGEDLLDKLKELSLGVSTAMVEEVTVDPEFFNNI